MLQTSFPKLKKHHPTNLYMLYPMMQSVAHVCVEKVKKMPSQWHCPLSSPKSFWCVATTPQRFTVGAASNTPACWPEALPARYRRTASISTYTHIVGFGWQLTTAALRCCTLPPYLFIYLPSSNLFRIQCRGSGNEQSIENVVKQFKILKFSFKIGPVCGKAPAFCSKKIKQKAKICSKKAEEQKSKEANDKHLSPLMPKCHQRQYHQSETISSTCIGTCVAKNEQKLCWDHGFSLNGRFLVQTTVKNGSKIDVS
jgi:hypothetical protein